MFSTRHLTSFLTLTALTCTAAELYCSQAKTKSEVAQVLAKIEVTQAQTKSESAQAQVTSEVTSNAQEQAKGAATQEQSETPAYKAFLALKDYKTLLPELLNLSTKAKTVQNLVGAEKSFDSLLKKKSTIVASEESFKKDKRPIFADSTQNETIPNFDEDVKKAQDALATFRDQVLQELIAAYKILEQDFNKQFSLGSSAEIFDQLAKRSTDLEKGFKAIPGSLSAEYLAKLQGLQQAIKERKANLSEEAQLKNNKNVTETPTMANAAPQIDPQQFDQPNFWRKITNRKYALPMIAALAAAAVGLTYGETKHKFISKLLWGKQPEKVIQLSWWARWWTGLKHLLRFA